MIEKQDIKLNESQFRARINDGIRSRSQYREIARDLEKMGFLKDTNGNKSYDYQEVISALKGFQESVGIKSDGMYGRITKAEIEKAKIENTEVTAPQPEPVVVTTQKTFEAKQEKLGQKTPDPSKEIKITETGKIFTRYMEGFSSNVYRCPTGFNTIGFGTSNEIFQKEKESIGVKGNSIEAAQAVDLQEKTYEEKREVAREKFGENTLSKLRPNERDAIMDFVYNMKPHSIGKGLIARVNDLANFEGSEEARKKLVDAVGSKIMQYDTNMHGLQERRKAEVMLLEGDYEGLQKHMERWKGEGGIEIIKKGEPSGKYLAGEMPDFAKGYENYTNSSVVTAQQAGQKQTPENSLGKL